MSKLNKSMVGSRQKLCEYEALSIPSQLCDEKFRFIKIKAGTKQAAEKGWTEGKNYSYNDPEFLKYLETASAYGVLCGESSSFLAIIDCDKKGIAHDIFMKLPNTFTVQSPSGGRHYYYIIKDLTGKIIMTDNAGVHHGEIQFTGTQCVGAGSTLANDKQYKIIDNSEIAEITKKQLDEVIKPYCKEKKKKIISNNTGFGLDISPVADKTCAWV